MLPATEFAQRLLTYLDDHPRSSIPERLGCDSVESLRTTLIAMAAQPDPAQMQARIDALEQQLQALSTQNIHPAPIPSALPTMSTPMPFKLEMREVNGEGAHAAREFARQAKFMPFLMPNASSDYLNKLMSARLTGSASYWADSWLSDVRNASASFEQFVDAFVEQFVECSNVQQLVLRSLHAAKQVSTLEQLYTYMTQHIVVLKERPRDQELVLVYTNAIRDHDVRIHVLSRYPKTLEQAHTFALEATGLRRASQAPQRSRQPFNSSHSTQQYNHDPRPRREHTYKQQQPNQQRNTPFALHAAHLPYMPTVPPLPSQKVPHYPRLSRLDERARQECQEKNLCFRCRQQGHFASACPKGRDFFRTQRPQPR
jgi:hypothetical protein